MEGSFLFFLDLLTSHEPGRFMESPLFLSDLLTGHEPRDRSAGLQPA